jgi:hypothetical protein
MIEALRADLAPIVSGVPLIAVLFAVPHKSTSYRLIGRPAPRQLGGGPVGVGQAAQRFTVRAVAIATAHHPRLRVGHIKLLSLHRKSEGLA